MSTDAWLYYRMNEAGLDYAPGGEFDPGLVLIMEYLAWSVPEDGDDGTAFTTVKSIQVGTKYPDMETVQEKLSALEAMGYIVFLPGVGPRYLSRDYQPTGGFYLSHYGGSLKVKEIR